MLSYLDHNASTPMHDRVLQSMLPWLQQMPGNAASPHRFGRAANSAIELARQQVADLIGAQPAQILFTSGGTESNNLALLGARQWQPGDVLAISRIEHPSVIATAKALESRGVELRWIEVDQNGVIDLQSAEQAMLQAHLLSCMLANNETGAVQPIAELSSLPHKQVLLHVDAVQAAGRMALNVKAMNADFVSLSGHKINGPKGVGALFVRDPSALHPILFGGQQQQGLRPGSENTAAIVGMGEAAELARHNQASQSRQWLQLRQHLEQGLLQNPSIHIFSAAVERLPNTCYLSVDGLHGEALLLQLDKAGIAVSSGSACHSQITEPSHVLEAMGVSRDRALGAIRISFGLGTETRELDHLIETISRLASQPLLQAGAS